MSVTIFCTFEQQDMADLAVGRLRNSTLGIKSIHYIGGYNTSNNVLNKNSMSDWNGSLQMTSTPQIPSRPVTVKIVCSDASARTVKARLVNMRAYQIITTG